MKKKKKRKKKESTPYQVGTHYEYKAKEQLEKEGCLVIRSAGSHSPFDLVSLNRLGVDFIQIKKCKNMKEVKQALKQFEQKMEELDKLYNLKNLKKNELIFIFGFGLKEKDG